MTAAIALYQQHKLPLPWLPAKEKIPLIVYGGSSAVGAFAIKLAKLSKISPIIGMPPSQFCHPHEQAYQTI
jgi:NADPH:quinone reductase-like Zn-dependent oxidoreductase